MKLIQINAWLGRLNGPLARFIAQEKPDIICMQEAYLPHPDGPSVLKDQYNFLDEIRQVSELPYEFFAKNWGIPVGGVVYEEGNVILSRFPISNHEEAHIHGNYHVRSTEADAISNTRNWQAATLTLVNGQTLTVSNYQGYLDGPHGMGNEITIKTMQDVRDRLAVLPRPLLFAGDMNFWPESPALKVLDDLNLRNLSVENNLTTTLSVAHRAPDRDRNRAMCDYIFVSPEINVKNFNVSDEIVSDHKALVLEFEI